MLNVTFRRFERSGALEARICDIGERLQRCDRRITQCHISVLGGAAGDGSVSALRKAYEGARSQLRSLQRASGRPFDGECVL